MTREHFREELFRICSSAKIKLPFDFGFSYSAEQRVAAIQWLKEVCKRPSLRILFLTTLPWSGNTCTIDLPLDLLIERFTPDALEEWDSASSAVARDLLQVAGIHPTIAVRAYHLWSESQSVEQHGALIAQGTVALLTVQQFYGAKPSTPSRADQPEHLHDIAGLARALAMEFAIRKWVFEHRLWTYDIALEKNSVTYSDALDKVDKVIALETTVLFGSLFLPIEGAITFEGMTARPILGRPGDKPSISSKEWLVKRGEQEFLSEASNEFLIFNEAKKAWCAQQALFERLTAPLHALNRPHFVTDKLINAKVLTLALQDYCRLDMSQVKWFYDIVCREKFVSLERLGTFIGNEIVRQAVVLSVEKLLDALDGEPIAAEARV